MRIMFAVLVTLSLMACGSTEAEHGTEVARARSGEIEVVLLADQPALTRGKAAFTLEFHAASDSARLFDVGMVKASAAMPMAGMAPMMAPVSVAPTDTPGRYVATSDLAMAGEWQLMIEWDGPSGRGSVSLTPRVQ
jgi:YtkA-like